MDLDIKHDLDINQNTPAVGAVRIMNYLDISTLNVTQDPGNDPLSSAVSPSHTAATYSARNLLVLFLFELLHSYLKNRDLKKKKKTILLSLRCQNSRPYLSFLRPF